MLRVGTSGWHHEDWHGTFYPSGLPKTRWLAHYAATFGTVEINNSFYRMPSPEVFARWAARTPPDFCCAVKANRVLTHLQRLHDPGPVVEQLLAGAIELGDKLGPVLVQIPPGMRIDTGLLAETLSAFRDEVRVVFEPRDPSWHDDRVYDLLAEHDAALCWWDRLGERGPLVRTTSWVYVRMREGRAWPPRCYGRDALARWCDRIIDTYGTEADGYVYFANGPGTCAPPNAARLARLARRRGLRVARSPARLAPPVPRPGDRPRAERR